MEPVKTDLSKVSDMQGNQIFSVTSKFNGEQSEFFSIHESAAIELMKLRGGHFAAYIACAYLRADLTNRARMLAAFSDMFFDYAQEAARDKEYRARHG